MNVLWLLICIFILHIGFLFIVGKWLPVTLLPGSIAPTKFTLVQTQLCLIILKDWLWHVLKFRRTWANFTSTDYGFMMIHAQEGKFWIQEEVTFHSGFASLALLLENNCCSSLYNWQHLNHMMLSMWSMPAFNTRLNNLNIWLLNIF